MKINVRMKDSSNDDLPAQSVPEIKTNMKGLLTLALLLPYAFAWDDVILQPPAGKSGSAKALYFAQGGEMKEHVGQHARVQKERLFTTKAFGQYTCPS